MASRAALVVISALCLSSLASAQLFGPPAVLKPLIAQLKAVNAKPGVYKYTSIVNLLQNRGTATGDSPLLVYGRKPRPRPEPAVLLERGARVTWSPHQTGDWELLPSVQAPKSAAGVGRGYLW